MFSKHEINCVHKKRSGCKPAKFRREKLCQKFGSLFDFPKRLENLISKSKESERQEVFHRFRKITEGQFIIG